VTCIVGLADGGDIWIGGDSAGVAGLDLVVRADQKVFRNGEFLFGFTSSFRMGNLLRFKLSLPRRYPGTDVYEFMVTSFVDAVRDCLKAGGFARKDNEVESGGAFLVGYAGQLFEIGSDYQVGQNVDGFAALGCGAPVALGALFVTQGQPAEQRLLTALAAAERFSAGVRAPFVIEHLVGSSAV
jgi:hypothetical protein